MTRGPIYIDSDNLLEVRGVINTATEEPINDATVEVTLYDVLPEDGGTALSGMTWPFELTYVTDTDGNYRGTLEDTLVIGDLTGGKLKVEIDGDSLQATLWFDVVFSARAEPSLGWSSREEIEDLFGSDNVAKWADKDNDASEIKIRRRIRRAIEYATSDARMKLTDTSVKLSEMSDPPVVLRDAVSRMAGVWLYETRGVADTADEEGKHVLTTHKKQAEKFYNGIRSGRYRIDAGVKRTPIVVKDEDTEDEDTETDTWPDSAT